MVSRLLTFVSQWVSRIAVGTTLLFSDGATTVSPGYPVDNSMSAMARFPWVWTCVRAVAGDAAGLPVVARRKTSGASKRAKRELVDDPALALLENPSTGVTGTLFRKQLWVDYLLTGNAFVWKASAVELVRLHPSHVQPVVQGLSRLIVAFEVNAPEGKLVLPPEQVLFIRDVSWSSEASAVLGESAIRPLHDDLSMEFGAKRLAAEQAQTGRPEMLFSTELGMGDNMADAIVDRWERAKANRRGAFAFGRGLKATPISYSPREFEFQARSEVVRDVVLAVFEVPPARAGLSSANYGTQKQQMRTYWESVQRRAKVFDDAFSTLAGPGIRIEHDFSDVEALQVSYTERLMRVTTWIGIGAHPDEAAAYENFDDAPVPHDLADFHSPRPIDRQPEEPQGDKALTARLGTAIGAYLSEAAPRFAELRDAVAGGADVSILLRWEAERAFAAIDRLVADHAVARWWADEITAQTLEAVRIADATTDVENLEAFTSERAHRIAGRIATTRRAA